MPSPATEHGRAGRANNTSAASTYRRVPVFSIPAFPQLFVEALRAARSNLSFLKTKVGQPALLPKSFNPAQSGFRGKLGHFGYRGRARAPGLQPQWSPGRHIRFLSGAG
jgi:hypothetical protein